MLKNFILKKSVKCLYLQGGSNKVFLNITFSYGSFSNFNVNVNVLKITKGFSSSSRSSKAD